MQNYGDLVRIFKTKWLARFVRRVRIVDEDLIEAIERAERGLIDADLGGGLIKQRVARTGQGRSGGYRMLLAYRAQDRAVFLYGFAKNEREDIDPDELVSLREAAAGWLAANAELMAQAALSGKLQEIPYDEEKTQPVDASHS